MLTNYQTLLNSGCVDNIKIAAQLSNLFDFETVLQSAKAAISQHLQTNSVNCVVEIVNQFNLMDFFEKQYLKYWNFKETIKQKFEFYEFSVNQKCLKLNCDFQFDTPNMQLDANFVDFLQKRLLVENYKIDQTVINAMATRTDVNLFLLVFKNCDLRFVTELSVLQNLKSIEFENCKLSKQLASFVQKSPNINFNLKQNTI